MIQTICYMVSYDRNLCYTVSYEIIMDDARVHDMIHRSMWGVGLWQVTCQAHPAVWYCMHTSQIGVNMTTDTPHSNWISYSSSEIRLSFATVPLWLELRHTYYKTLNLISSFYCALEDSSASAYDNLVVRGSGFVAVACFSSVVIMTSRQIRAAGMIDGSPRLELWQKRCQSDLWKEVYKCGHPKTSI